VGWILAYNLARRALRQAVAELSPVSADHKSTSYTLSAGAELTIHSLSGIGSCTVVFYGDGDGVFNMRVYVDGSLDDSFPTNQPRIGLYTFYSSLEIRVHNPLEGPASHTSSGYNLRGLARLT
jgi:hypothetical protein